MIKQPIDESVPASVRPSPVDFGHLAPGSIQQRLVQLMNPTGSPVDVESVVTSCPCLKVIPDKVRIPAGKSVPLEFHFDSTAEPDFRGRLAIEVTGLDSGGRKVFRTTADVAVLTVHEPN